MQHGMLLNKIRSYVQQTEYSEQQILESLSLYIYQKQGDINDLYILAKLLPEGTLSNLIAYYDGDSLNLPTKEEYKNSKILAVSFFLREIKKWSWEDIREFLDLPEEEIQMINSYSLGKKIATIKEELNYDIEKLLEQLKTKIKECDIEEFLHD